MKKYILVVFVFLLASCTLGGRQAKSGKSAPTSASHRLIHPGHHLPPKRPRQCLKKLVVLLHPAPSMLHRTAMMPGAELFLLPMQPIPMARSQLRIAPALEFNPLIKAGAKSDNRSISRGNVLPLRDCEIHSG